MTDTVEMNIAEDLLPLARPVGELTLHPQNYRHGDVETIVASLTRFGQVRPIVVQKSSGRVVAGNHTMKAVLELGWPQIAAALVDMPDEEAEAYLVADNRASDKATNDDAALSAILERLMLAGRLEGTGYSPDDVDDMLAAMAALPEVEPEPTEATAGVTDDKLAERFKNRSQVALRQFVLMYPQDGTSDNVEAMANRLKRAWGVSSMADVVREALTRATAEPPVEGLTDEERERADAPVAPAEGTADHLLVTEKPETNERIYRHAGCASFVVPMDDSVAPTEAECAECAALLPVRMADLTTGVEVPADAATQTDAQLERDPATDTTEGAAGAAGVAEAAPDIEPTSPAAAEPAVADPWDPAMPAAAEGE